MITAFSYEIHLSVSALLGLFAVKYYFCLNASTSYL